MLPHCIRWNRLNDYFEVYMNEWPKLLQICEAHDDDVNRVIFQFVLRINITRMNNLKLLKPVSIALDRIQQEGIRVSHAVQERKTLGTVFNNLAGDSSLHQFQIFKR